MTDQPPIFTPLIGPSPHTNPGEADMADIPVLADDRLSYYRLIAMSAKVIRMLEVVRGDGRLEDALNESQDEF